MGMLRDFLRIYGCITGAGLVVAGFVVSILGILYLGALFLLGFYAGGALVSWGAALLYVIIGDEDEYVAAVPQGPVAPTPPPSPDSPVERSFVQERLELPAWPVLLAVFLIAVGAGVVAIQLNSALAMVLPYVIVATFPPLVWISYVYSHQGVEPEPPRLVLIALTGGMLSVIPALMVNTGAQLVLIVGLLARGYEEAPLWAYVVVPVLVAPIVEEAVKPLVLRYMKNDIFSELDGILYGVTAGMGFALLENMSYLAFGVGALLGVETTMEGDLTVAWTFTALARGLGSIGIHAIGAGLIGRAYARMLEGRGGQDGIIHAYLTAVAIHAGWNGISSLSLLDFFQGAGFFVLVCLIAIYAAGIFILLRRTILEAMSEDRGRLAPGSKTRRRAARADARRKRREFRAWERQYRAWQVQYQRYLYYHQVQYQQMQQYRLHQQHQQHPQHHAQQGYAQYGDYGDPRHGPGPQGPQYGPGPAPPPPSWADGPREGAPSGRVRSSAEKRPDERREEGRGNEGRPAGSSVGGKSRGRPGRKEGVDGAVDGGDGGKRKAGGKKKG